MNIENLKHVVGTAEMGKPAVIRFFGPVDRWTVEEFNREFVWLQDYIKPSKIIVMINSEGGSVVYGMSTFSLIQSCPIEVECVICGIAASMGSVIWAAGKRLFMHDYSILMVHNPFKETNCEAVEQDENTKAMIEAFRAQLELIYCKRFAMKKDEVQKMMNGEGNVDGTYFNAKQAVEAGIIDKSNVIKTSKRVRDDVKAKIDGIEDASQLRDALASLVTVEPDKLRDEVTAILEQTNENIINQKKMEQDSTTLMTGILNQLGFNESSQLNLVSGRIDQLVKAEIELTSTKAELDELKIKYAGKETEVMNLTDKLTDVEGQLQKYRDAEEAARLEAVNDLINQAVEDGKIKAEVKEKWVQMAKDNFDIVKDTLDSIPGRQKITEEIANDKENQQNALTGQTATERELAEKVNAVIGKDFQFRKLED